MPLHRRNSQGNRDEIKVSGANDVEIAKLKAELAEADRRAGAAERRLADMADTLAKLNSSRDRMKAEAGYHANVSFDVVWAETLAKANR